MYVGTISSSLCYYKLVNLMYVGTISSSLCYYKLVNLMYVTLLAAVSATTN